MNFRVLGFVHPSKRLTLSFALTSFIGALVNDFDTDRNCQTFECLLELFVFLLARIPGVPRIHMKAA